MTANIDHLYEPDKDEADYLPFIAPSAALEAFDIETAEYWCGRHESRLDEIVFRIQDRRWVLGYVPTPGHENYDRPQPSNRELTPSEAARWFQINRRRLPKGLAPVVTGSKQESGGGLTRLDREWRPSPQSPSAAGREQANKKALIITLFENHRGLSNAEIARRVGCHPGTVSKYLGAVRKALGESSRRDAIGRHERRGGPKGGRRGMTRQLKRREGESEEDDSQGGDDEDDD